mgnify:FL=1
MPAKKKIEEAVQAVENEVKKTGAAAKRTAKKVADKAAANEIEAKKATRKTTRKVKEAVEATEAKVEKKAARAKAAKLEIIVQSPMGGNITAEEIAAKIPAGSDSVFVRVDQNKLWWIKGEETGSVDIWE